jgi:hypothetical protein
MNPSCCQSPAHVSNIPSWAHAAAAVLILVAVAWLLALGWAWMSSPYVRHACLRCVKEACQFCIDEERNRRVDTYVEQARERKAARDG